MSLLEDGPARPKRVHEIGEDLYRLSTEDLAERIEQLRAEITRLEADMKSKVSTRNAAEALFRRG